MLNSNKNVNTGQFSDEIFIKFNLNNSFDVVFNPEHEYYNLEAKRKLYQQKTSDVTAYAQFHIKFRYDKDYTPLLHNTDDTTFLNLHQSYRIPDIHGKKLAQQQIEFSFNFEIVIFVLRIKYNSEKII
jgi:hypothetical protein